MRRTSIVLTSLLLAGGVLAACGSEEDPPGAGETGEPPAGETTTTGESAAAPDECVAEAGTLTEGVLTIATDEPAFPPWIVDDDPTNGEGFESAVAYAVAAELGFGEATVEWVRVPFNNAIAPGDKDFDIALNQYSISEEREEAVDFSSGYYDVNQAIVGFEDSAAAGATSIADLQGLRLGAQVGTTSLDFITDVIQPTTDPFVYNDNSAAKAALDAEQIDAIVLDLPTAYYVSAVEIEGTAVIGQFPAPTEDPEQFGILLQEGNPLRDCVSEAVDALRESGDLAAIQQEWLSDVVDAPVIEG